MGWKEDGMEDGTETATDKTKTYASDAA